MTGSLSRYLNGGGSIVSFRGWRPGAGWAISILSRYAEGLVGRGGDVTLPRALPGRLEGEGRTIGLRRWVGTKGASLRHSHSS